MGSPDDRAAGAPADDASAPRTADQTSSDGGTAPDADDAPAPRASGAAPGVHGGSAAHVHAAAPDAGGDGGAHDVPSAEELERLAVDVRIRRRPRIGVFIVLGMLVAGVAALVWAMSVPQQSHVNWGSTVWVTTLGAIGFGALLGAGVAVFADWLSRRE